MRKKILCILVIIFLSVQLGFYSEKAYSAQQVRAQGATTIDANAKILNILEIEPGKTFSLNTNSFANTGDYKINITQMSMPEFISKIDNINGKYDIVYLGDNVINNLDYTDIGRRPTYIPEGGINGGLSTEYYSENDITNNSANKLKEFIESGQLMIVSTNALSNTKTKLYSNFKVYMNNNNYNNFVLAQNNLSGSQIINDYNKNANKRPQLTLISTPTKYDGSLSSYQDIDTNNNMNFKFNMSNSLNDTMTAKLYTDENGDGIYQDSECVQVLNNKPSDNGYNMLYKIRQSFYGLMQWKIEITDDKTNAKNYITGSVAFKQNKLPTVRVLQIDPSNNKNTFSIGRDLKVPLHVNGEYDIQVTEINIADLNSSYPNNISGTIYNTGSDGKVKATQSNNIPTIFNSNYDMIVMGFADMYGGNSGGGSDITNSNVMQELKNFIKTGQSVMFTHDTLTYKVNNDAGWGLNITNQFRDIIGQSRYIDKNNPSEENLDGTSIIHDNYPNNSLYSYGFTNVGLDRANGINFSKYTNANKINDGLITEFPYILKDILPVASTHYQYYQLDLEDPNVVPWYTLYGSGIDESDGRNNYYTYSKGNITYSGTGHSSPSTSVDENQFFVNTIIKASRGANHAPTVVINNPSDGSNISKGQSNIDVNFTPNDQDGDTLKGEVYVNNELVKAYNSGEITAGTATDLKIDKSNISRIVGNNTNFKITVNVTDARNGLGTQTVNLNYVNEPSLSMDSNVEAGYLTGDEANITLTAMPAASVDNIKTLMKNINYSLDYGNDPGIALDSDATWNIPDINFTPNPDKEAQTKSIKFKMNNAGTYNIKNTLQYTFSNINNENSELSELDYTIPVRSGVVDVEVVDPNGKVINDNGISVAISEPDGTTENPSINNTTGEAELINKKTGSYNVTLNLPDAYRVVSEGMQDQFNDPTGTNILMNDTQSNAASVNIDYSHPQPKIIFKVGKVPATPIIGEFKDNTSQDVVTDDSQTAVNVSARFPGDSNYLGESTLDMSQNNIVKKEMSINRGEWVNYNPMSNVSNGTIISVRCTNSYGVTSNVANFEVCNVAPKGNINYELDQTNKSVLATLNVDNNDINNGASVLGDDGTSSRVHTLYFSDSVSRYNFTVEEDVVDVCDGTKHKNISIFPAQVLTQRAER